MRELDALGWRLIVVTAQDLYDAPEQVLVRVRAALIERGATGIRRQFKTEWLRYFTVLERCTADSKRPLWPLWAARLDSCDGKRLLWPLWAARLDSCDGKRSH